MLACYTCMTVYNHVFHMNAADLCSQSSCCLRLEAPEHWTCWLYREVGREGVGEEEGEGDVQYSITTVIQRCVDISNCGNISSLILFCSVSNLRAQRDLHVP